MPVTTTVTCDICGETANAYPSFFHLRNVNEHTLVPLGDESSNVFKAASVERKVDTAGCLRFNLHVYLCRDHFASLRTACEEWLAAQS